MGAPFSVVSFGLGGWGLPVCLITCDLRYRDGRYCTDIYEYWLLLSFYRAHPNVSLEALHHQCARQLKQNDQLQEQGGSKQLEPPFPSPSHTSAVGKKGPSEQDKGEEGTDEGGGGVGGDGRKKGELGAVRGVEGAPISSPAWKLMAKELAR